jgi:hypothetical protein
MSDQEQISRGCVPKRVEHPPRRRKPIRLLQEGAIARYNFPAKGTANAEKRPLSS